MPQLDIQLAQANEGRRATVMQLPGQVEGDTLPREIVDAIRGLWSVGIEFSPRASLMFYLAFV